MKSRKKTKKIISALWIGTVLLVLSFSIMEMQSIDKRSGEQWQNYYSIITSDAVSIEKLLVKLELPYLSFNNSEVVFNDISNMKNLSLIDISERFNSLDPRIDPYMNNVHNLFQVQSEESPMDIVYVEKESISLLFLYANLLNQFSKESLFWTISGFDPVKIFIPIVLYSLFCLLFLFLCKKYKILIFFALSGWFPFVYIFGIPGLFSAVSVSYLFYRKSNPLAVLSVCILTYLYAFYSFNLSLDFNLLFCCGILVGSILYLMEEKKDEKRILSVNHNIPSSMSSRRWNKRKITFRKPEHELFSPVQIMATPKRKVKRVKVVQTISSNKDFLKPLAASFLVLSMFSLFIHIKPEEFILPLAVEQVDLSWSLESTALTVIDEQDRNNYIISPADYISHLAYQEGFLYGSKWEYPQLENPLLYPIYNSIDNVFAKSYEIKAEYSEKWFIEKVSLLKNENPAKLLFSTQHPGFVIKKSNHDNYQSFMLLKISFSMLLLLLLFFSDEKVFSKRSINIKKKLLRRNEQVA